MTRNSLRGFGVTARVPPSSQSTIKTLKLFMDMDNCTTQAQGLPPGEPQHLHHTKISGAAVRLAIAIFAPLRGPARAAETTSSRRPSGARAGSFQANTRAVLPRAIVTRTLPDFAEPPGTISSNITRLLAPALRAATAISAQTAARVP
mmetsp:Transcript_12425/g.30166  ORF Transcript_12425/g.30166 Transcript_12425/m.30166 type:complete len:148 (+) Transcript_12425:2712-3155(+)